MSSRPSQFSVQTLENRINNNPRLRAFSRLADEYRKNGDIQRAVDLCIQGLQYHPGYVTGRIILGWCYLEQENFSGAIEEFKKVCQVDKRNHLALKMLADTFARQGLIDKAGDVYSMLFRMDPSNNSLKTLAAQNKGTGKTDLFEIVGLTYPQIQQPSSQPISYAPEQTVVEQNPFESRHDKAEGEELQPMVDELDQSRQNEPEVMETLDAGSAEQDQDDIFGPQATSVADEVEEIGEEGRNKQVKGSDVIDRMSMLFDEDAKAGQDVATDRKPEDPYLQNDIIDSIKKPERDRHEDEIVKEKLAPAPEAISGTDISSRIDELFGDEGTTSARKQASLEKQELENPLEGLMINENEKETLVNRAPSFLQQDSDSQFPERLDLDDSRTDIQETSETITESTDDVFGSKNESTVRPQTYENVIKDSSSPDDLSTQEFEETMQLDKSMLDGVKQGESGNLKPEAPTEELEPDSIPFVSDEKRELMLDIDENAKVFPIDTGADDKTAADSRESGTTGLVLDNNEELTGPADELLSMDDADESETAPDVIKKTGEFDLSGDLSFGAEIRAEEEVEEEILSNQDLIETSSIDESKTGIDRDINDIFGETGDSSVKDSLIDDSVAETSASPYDLLLDPQDAETIQMPSPGPEETGSDLDNTITDMDILVTEPRNEETVSGTDVVDKLNDIFGSEDMNTSVIPEEEDEEKGPGKGFYSLDGEDASEDDAPAARDVKEVSGNDFFLDVTSPQEPSEKNEVEDSEDNRLVDIISGIEAEDGADEPKPRAERIVIEDDALASNELVETLAIEPEKETVKRPEPKTGTPSSIKKEKLPAEDDIWPATQDEHVDAIDKSVLTGKDVKQRLDQFFPDDLVNGSVKADAIPDDEEDSSAGHGFYTVSGQTASSENADELPDGIDALELTSPLEMQLEEETTEPGREPEHQEKIADITTGNPHDDLLAVIDEENAVDKDVEDADEPRKTIEDLSAEELAPIDNRDKPYSIPDHVLTPTLADIYFQQGQPQLSLQIYTRLVEKDPDNDYLRMRLDEIKESIRKGTVPLPQQTVPPARQRSSVRKQTSGSSQSGHRNKTSGDKRPLAGIHLRKLKKNGRKGKG